MWLLTEGPGGWPGRTRHNMCTAGCISARKPGKSHSRGVSTTATYLQDDPSCYNKISIQVSLCWPDDTICAGSQYFNPMQSCKCPWACCIRCFTWTDLSFSSFESPQTYRTCTATATGDHRQRAKHLPSGRTNLDPRSSQMRGLGGGGGGGGGDVAGHLDLSRMANDVARFPVVIQLAHIFFLSRLPDPHQPACRRRDGRAE